MVDLLRTTFGFLNTPHFLAITAVISFFTKVYFLLSLFTHVVRHSAFKSAQLFLAATIGFSLFGDIAWIVKLARSILHLPVSYATLVFFIRVAWGALLVQYQSLTYFINSLVAPVHKRSRIALSIGIVSAFLASFFFLTALLNYGEKVNEASRIFELKSQSPNLEMLLMRLIPAYLLIFLAIPTLFSITRHMRSKDIPKIVRKQLTVFFIYLVCPFLLIEFLIGSSFIFDISEASLYMLVSLSTMLLVVAIIFCFKKIMRLRFLNFSTHVQDTKKVGISKEFKALLEQLPRITSSCELHHIVRTFFKEVIAVEGSKVSIHLRDIQPQDNQIGYGEKESKTIQIVTSFIQNPENDTLLRHEQILIYDEINFTNFYNSTHNTEQMRLLLTTLSADILLPIYHKKILIAFIVVGQNEANEHCFSATERGEMAVLGNYIGSTLTLLRNQNIAMLTKQQRVLNSLLYQLHQEINQHRECIQYFLTKKRNDSVGITLYKKKQFIFLNNAAQEIISINLNDHRGHPFSGAMHSIVDHVITYATSCSRLVKNPLGNDIIVTALPHLNHFESVIITLHYPGIADIIKGSVDTFSNPTDWNYSLYLETTNSGKLIQQFIPPHSLLQQLRIEILKVSLMLEPPFIIGPNKDTDRIASIIQTIKKYTQCHTLSLSCPEKNDLILEKIFGSPHNSSPKPLLEQLGEYDVLYITNIGFCSVQTQQRLAHFMQFGSYMNHCGEYERSSKVHLMFSNERSTPAPIEPLAQLLQPTTIALPSLSSYKHEELTKIIESIVSVTIANNPLFNFLSLTEKEIASAINYNPQSFSELHEHVMVTINSKVAMNSSPDLPGGITNPLLVAAAQQGKMALKNRETMDLLWKTFKNQNKIAAFLGVNRSSISRRFKAFNDNATAGQA